MNENQTTNDKANRFFLLDASGKETPINSMDASEIETQFDPALVRLIMKVARNGKSPPGINPTNMMRQLEWIDYEPASDSGHFRFYPKGTMIRNLITAWCERVSVNDFGALPIKTPFLYRSENTAVREHIGIFSESVYFVSGDRSGAEERFVLRFNDDLGLYTMMKDARITLGHMPIRIYEQAPSFRYIKSGTLSGIRKGRYFSLNDVHSFCTDMEQGLAEYREMHRLMIGIADRLGLGPVTHFQVTRDFFPVVKPTMTALLSGEEQMLVEFIPRQKQYWIMKHIVHTKDMQRLFHIQFDLESSARFGIRYQSPEGGSGEYVIIHSSFGTIERWMLIILEDALKKDPPVLPLWLAPTQIRIIPVSEERHLDFGLDVARELKRHDIRVDVDDRNESLGWRIRAAEREWVPYVAVCGDKEQAGGPLSVRIRGAAQQRMSISELAALIKGQTEEMPFSFLPGILVSKRPVFRGRD
ncbi:MAG: His/Gly/Thr/Pro-type tRNA ligase C-terminal domain-containing protein [Candidatus Moraniibacteriota bacterium]